MSHAALPELTAYGWTSPRADHVPAGTHPARVVRHDGASLLAIADDGLRSLRTTLWLDPQPTVGDWVAVREPRDGSPADASIDQVLPRTSLLRRMTADGRGAQALAANVDVVLITCGMDRPVKAGRIHRAAAQAWDAGAHPVLVLTKAGAPSAADVDLPRLELEHPGIRVLVTSAQEGSGLDELREVVVGRTAVLVGESGAGKSTLTNALLGTEQAVTGVVREGDSKGRHTTSARYLHLIPGPDGGCIIDTPGIRSVGLFTDAEAVDATFADIQQYAGSCRFGDCAHLGEPGCAVLDASESGDLPRERYDAWRRLQKEVASAAMRSSPHEMRKHGKRFARAAKEGSALKRGGGDRGPR